MSPTKASLARFNPNLLPPRKSSRIPTATGTTSTAKPDRKKNPSFDWTISLHQRTEPIADTQSEEVSRRPRNSGANPPDIPASPPSAPHEKEKEMDDRAQRTANKQLAQELQDNTPPLAQSHAASSATIDVPRRMENESQQPEHMEEPELPPTPTELGLEPVREPPKGILFSSPSRRVSRRKKNPVLKSSPLKLGESTSGHTVVLDILPESQDSPSRQQHTTTEGRMTIEGQDSQPLPGVISTEEDPELMKKRAVHEQLSTQFENLQHDVTRLQTALSQAQQDPSLPASASASADLYNQEEIDELL